MAISYDICKTCESEIPLYFECTKTEKPNQGNEDIAEEECEGKKRELGLGSLFF